MRYLLRFLLLLLAVGCIMEARRATRIQTDRVEQLPIESSPVAQTR